MAWDFRLQSDILNHPKTIKLVRMHGAEGFLCLVRLFSFVTEYRPSGVLEGMDRADVAVACGVDPEHPEYVDDLVAIRWLDYNEQTGLYSVHNWELRQPNVFNREKISAQKKAAADARYAKNRQKKARAEARKTKKAQAVADESARALHVDMQMQCPNPTQPNLESKRDSLSHSHAPVREGERARELFFALVQEQVLGAKLGSAAAWTRELQRLLDAGWTVEGLMAVMQWALQDEFWSTKILSVKAFTDNFPKAAIKMRQETTTQGPSIGEAIASGCSEEEWEKMQAQRKGEGKERQDAPP